MQPIQGIRVLDFTTLLPGPMASLMLAEAGAEVIKIERPPGGEDMRGYKPKFGQASVNFALLNRGKRSIAIDLKKPEAGRRLLPLLKTADVLIEQFRPGVMERLALGYETLRENNPRLIYCSITGYGQSGPKAAVAAHDLNYVADTGMLSLAAGADGAPIPPAALVADIAAGAYPAVINILLALQQRARTGEGCKLDVSMTDNLFPFLYWALGNGLAAGRWPRPGGELVTGGSPRYQIYRTADDRFVAAAPLEDRFWTKFVAMIGLSPELADDSRDPTATRRAVGDIIRSRTAAEWQASFAEDDVCCCIIATVEEALADAHFRARGLFSRTVKADGREMPALPVAIVEAFRSTERAAGYPALGEASALLPER